ncbi:MAG: alginate export family protein [Bdellovibrionales bacterium]|nr:alginate export family protein [Bdellovibrionales bacterium]
MKPWFAVSLAFAMAGTHPVFAQTPDRLPPWIEPLVEDGSVYLDERYRFEYVDEAGLPKTAKASTLRTRLGVETGELVGFSGKLEFENVSAIGNQLYNSTVNGQVEYPVVADPEVTSVNEAYVSFSGLDQTVLRVGREALKIGDERFIGDVGWRQNNQTYDGVNISTEIIPDTRLFYGYVARVNRIFGDDSPVGKFDTDLHLVNLRYAINAQNSVSPYLYLLDIEDAAADSSATVGAQASGGAAVSADVRANYDANFAYQTDYADNPVEYSAIYWRGQLGLEAFGLGLSGGFESLGSDDGIKAFSTPFATLHAWNGWADRFLTVPDGGLHDAYAGASYSITDIGEYISKVSSKVVYHYFSSDEGSAKYGDEVDVLLGFDFHRFVSAGVKYAVFESAGFSRSVDKLIVTIQFHVAT